MTTHKTDRRAFFKQSVTLAGFSLLPQLPAKKSKLVFSTEGKYVRVFGPEDELEDLIIRFQTALWPQWRTNKYAVRNLRSSIKAARRSGMTVLYTGCSITRKAFEEAKRLHTC